MAVKAKSLPNALIQPSNTTAMKSRNGKTSLLFLSPSFKLKNLPDILIRENFLYNIALNRNCITACLIPAIAPKRLHFPTDLS